MSDHVVRHAAGERAVEARSAVGAHNDQVAALGLRGRSDRFAGIALPDEEASLHAGTTGRADQRLGNRLPEVSDLVDSWTDRGAIRQRRGNIDDADDEECGVELGGQLDRPLRGSG